MSAPSLHVIHLGLVPYARAWELQREVARARVSGEVDQDVLLLVEHPPVVTLGRSSKESHLVVPRELLSARGVELYEVERGGDVTFHGPGQLVGYPIIDLKRHRKDLHWYLRQVEESLIRAVADFGLAGHRNAGYTGVWVGGAEPGSAPDYADVAARQAAGAPRKLASIGVHARDWVTWHGFALNVTTDLSWFDLIVPCGIQSVTMTSMAREIGEADAPTVPEVGDRVGQAMAAVFALEATPTPPAWLAGLGVALEAR